MDINLNLYKIFYVTSKCNTFVEASERLCVSQPAVSKQIKNLEELLGTKLFYRDNRGLSLTSDGSKLLKYVEKSYDYLMAGEKIIKESTNLENGTLIIGAPAHIASFYLLQYIEKIQESHPNIFVRIINGTTKYLLDELEQHRIDFIIDSSPIRSDNTNMIIKPLVSYETCLIACPETEASFTDLNYIMPYARSAIRKNLEKELKEHDIELRVILEVETTDLIIDAVKKSIGAGYVVKESVTRELEEKSLKELETNIKLPNLELNLIYIEGHLTNLALFFINEYLAD